MVCGRAKSAPGGAAAAQRTPRAAPRGESSGLGARPRPQAPHRRLLHSREPALRRTVPGPPRSSGHARPAPPRRGPAGRPRSTRRCAGRRRPRPRPRDRRCPSGSGRCSRGPRWWPASTRPTSPWGAGHRGVDLLGEPGQPVHAALAGTVTFAGLLAGRGVVVVDHGDTRTTYEPVDGHRRGGRQVGRASVIGALQTVGSHCPPQACLHWGWLRGDDLPRPARPRRRRARAAAAAVARRARSASSRAESPRRRALAWSVRRGARAPRRPSARAARRRAQARGCACW